MQLLDSLFVRPAAVLLLITLLGSTPGPAWSQQPTSIQSVLVGGVQRSFLVHSPPNLQSPAPVVFVFHGGGGNPDFIARKTGMDEVADQNGFITIYPAGADRASGRGGGTWNIGGSYSASSANDVAFVRAILHDLGRNMPIDRSRIYAAGFSMGGVFAYRLACEMSGTFAAIAAVSATMVEPSCHPSSPVAVLHIHGTDDDRIPLNGGRGAMTTITNRMWPAPQKGVASWGRIDACAGEATSGQDGCVSYSGCRASVEYCVVPGGGHAWPSGASERAWAFFSANPKR